MGFSTVFAAFVSEKKLGHLKVGRISVSKLQNPSPMSLQWVSLYFSETPKMFERAYLRDALEYEAHITPIDSTHGHFGS